MFVIEWQLPGSPILTHFLLKKLPTILRLGTRMDPWLLSHIRALEFMQCVCVLILGTKKTSPKTGPSA